MAKKKIYSTDELIMAVVSGMQEKKAKSIKVLDLSKLNSGVADCFVICHGTSDKQVEAIADSVDEIVRKKTGEKPWSSEGKQKAEWILLDYINVIVHVFVEPKRNFYGLEVLWGDALITSFDDIE